MDCILHLLPVTVFRSIWYLIPLSKGAVSLCQINCDGHVVCTSDKHVRLTLENVLAETSGAETMVGAFGCGPE